MATADPLSPHTYPLVTQSDRLCHALAWTMQAYRDALAGRSTSAVHVLAFGESVLREAPATDEKQGRA